MEIELEPALQQVARGDDDQDRQQDLREYGERYYRLTLRAADGARRGA